MVVFLVGVIRYICDMPLVIVVVWFYFLCAVRRKFSPIVNNCGIGI